MKIFSFVSVILLLFTSVACKKQETTALATLKSNNNNPTSYLLRKVTTDVSTGTNGSYLLFDYNSHNLVSQIKRIQWGYGDINTTPVEKWYDTTTYVFTYQNDLPVRCALSDRFGVFRIFEYTYKGQQLVMRTEKFDESTIDCYHLYHYNADGKLIEVVDSSNQVNYRTAFEYQQNLTAITTYNLQDNPQKKTKTEYDNFDDKVNYIRAVNGLPETYNTDEMNLGNYSSGSPNNYRQEKYYWDVEINKNFNAPDIQNYSYEYNEEGLPTKMQYLGLTWTFDYQKYK